MSARLLGWLDSRIGSRLFVIVLALVLVSVTLLNSIARAGAAGFPVDDAWIFQTFARNLAQHGEISFNPGVPVTGASSFLWLLFEAVGYFLPFGVVPWSHLLTALGYVGVGLSMLEIAPLFVPGEHSRRWALFAAVLTLLEWHLLWLSLSGMETLLLIIPSLWLIYFALRGGSPWVLGVLGGIVTLTRVEGIILFGIVWLWVFRSRTWRERIVMLGFFGIVIAPMLATNWWIGGSLLPNTWSAKLTGVHQPIAGLQFLFEYTMMLLIGLNVLLIPALLFVWKAPRADKARFALPLLWCFGLLAVYVVAFPVIYHHLRYMMPTLPWFILLGVAGIARLFQETRSVGYLQAGLSTAFAIGLAIFGMNVYGWNVQNIQAQHVVVGQWLRDNTPPSARVAADDIGAIGFFSDRFIVDLAGLVTPEIVPTLRAQGSLDTFICADGVNYLAVFPHTQVKLADKLQLQEVFRAHLEFNTITPSADMIVAQVADCR